MNTFNLIQWFIFACSLSGLFTALHVGTEADKELNFWWGIFVMNGILAVGRMLG